MPTLQFTPRFFLVCLCLGLFGAFYTVLQLTYHGRFRLPARTPITGPLVALYTTYGFFSIRLLPAPLAYLYMDYYFAFNYRILPSRYVTNTVADYYRFRHYLPAIFLFPVLITVYYFTFTLFLLTIPTVLFRSSFTFTSSSPLLTQFVLLPVSVHSTYTAGLLPASSLPYCGRKELLRSLHYYPLTSVIITLYLVDFFFLPAGPLTSPCCGSVMGDRPVIVLDWDS